MTWFCPRCPADDDEHSEDEEFVLIEDTQFCMPHARTTTIASYAEWRES